LSRKISKPSICLLEGCKNPKREAKATCKEHDRFEQWVLREFYGFQHCPCFPGPARTDKALGRA
jgi:hypothetical protein